MRKAQKQRLLDLVSTLYEAHKVIEENLSNGNIEMTKILLSDCQDAAVQMGNVIEQSEGAGSFTVHLLEDYCEVLFRIYEDIAAYKNSDRTGISLDQALLRVGNSMEEDNEPPRGKPSSTVLGSYVAAHSTCLLHLLTHL